MKKDLDIIYNLEYLVIVPKMTKDLYENIHETFENTILIDNNVEDLNFIIDFINKNNFRQLIFVDFQEEYTQIINGLNNSHEIKFIYTGSLGALSDPFKFYIFNGLYKFYSGKIASSIGFIDEAFYQTLKNKGENVFKIQLEITRIEKQKTVKSQVGLLNNEGDAKHSFYNELSALRLSNKYYANVYNPNKVTKKFLKLFDIKHVFSKNIDDLISRNEVNLYINFTNNDINYFIKSMDLNIPCILGNNEFLNEYPKLQKYLMVKSDDNIDEISKKIEEVINNKDEIIKEYEKFRKKYSKEVVELKNKFIGKEILRETKKEYEKLISIIVPVYNVEKFLEKSLNSILDAVIKDCEILIINDGSTDNSENVINKYVKKYPDLIRYIKQENHGLGNVRNVALKEAKGKYIASIDSDDTIDPYFFRDCKEYIDRDIDIIIYDFETITNDERYQTPALDPIFKNENRYEGILYTTIMPSTCNKIIKKSLYEKLNIKYIEDKYEDLSTNPFVLFEAKTLKYFPRGYYEYYIRENSIMRSSAGYSMIDIIKVVNDRLIKYKNSISVEESKFKYYTFSWRIEQFIMNQLYDMDELELKKYTKYIYENVYEILVEVFDSNYYKSMLNKLNNLELANFIKERNEAFKNKKIEQFVKDKKKNNNIYKLTPATVLYGD